MLAYAIHSNENVVFFVQYYSYFSILSDEFVVRTYELHDRYHLGVCLGLLCAKQINIVVYTAFECIPREIKCV